MKNKEITTLIMCLIFALLISALGTWIVMLLINWVLTLKGINYEISFWMTWAIIVVVQLVWKLIKKGK